MPEHVRGTLTQFGLSRKVLRTHASCQVMVSSPIPAASWTAASAFAHSPLNQPSASCGVASAATVAPGWTEARTIGSTQGWLNMAARCAVCR
jgi:hypothetical protein